MDETESPIRAAYAAFNARDVDRALALMTEDVRWPKASEGGTVVGKDEIRAYWTRQWQEFDPHVEPVRIEERSDGTIDVVVRQRVETKDGDPLFDGDVVHRFRIVDGKIAHMELVDGHEGAGPSDAFQVSPVEELEQQVERLEDDAVRQILAERSHGAKFVAVTQEVAADIEREYHRIVGE